MNQLNILFDVAIALLLGGILGFEREWKQKPAGLRTNMIICGASALFISLGRVVINDFEDLTKIEGMGIDPTRVLHAVIVGVGFIGAGTILKSPDNTGVKYLTTSATIWMSAGIGIAVGLKYYLLAASISIILVVVNFLFDKFNDYIEKVSKYAKEGDKQKVNSNDSAGFNDS